MRERNMREIQSKIKDIIWTYLPDKTLTNKKMASYFNIPYSTYNTQLKRNSIPYKEIMFWCARTGTNPLEVFYEKKANQNKKISTT